MCRSARNMQRNAYRNDIVDMLLGFPTFWNVRHA
jgi:hypothetical protein